MSRKPHKAAASSSRVAIGNPSTAFGTGFGTTSATTLSYLTEQPDLSVISDANLIVSFKNLSKKDGVTKAKALEDIQEYVTRQHSADTQIEDSVFDVWVKFYPRISIDVARRVRLLSHAVQGELFSAGGKRAAKYMNQVVGAWMLGLYDGDRTVMRSADEAFKLVFKSHERREDVKKIYQHSIVTFCGDALLRESAQSLSDERTTTPDDLEAKYNRLMSSSLSVVTHLLSTLPAPAVEKEQSSYDEILASAKIWNLVFSTDAQVRRSVYSFTNLCMSHKQAKIAENIKPVAHAFLSRKTPRNQTGSATQFLESLAMLSASFPSIWTDYIPSKTEPLDYIQMIGKQGSQGASSQFWRKLAEIFQGLPDTILPHELETAEKVLQALHAGITRKDEPRANGEDAWNCYLIACDQAQKNLEREQQRQLNLSMQFPIVRQYVSPSNDDAQWSIAGSNVSKTVAKALQNADVVSATESEWDSLASRLLETIQTSAPEQSKDFESSQNSVSSKGTRWFGFQSMLHELDLPDSFQAKVLTSNKEIIEGSLKLLQSRDGKPYGAAAVVEAALRLAGLDALARDGTLESITAFAMNSLPLLVDSPSRKPLIAIIYLLSAEACFPDVWNRSLRTIMEVSKQENTLTLLSLLLGSVDIPDKFELPSANTTLQRYIDEQTTRALKDTNDWDFLTIMLRSQAEVLTLETLNNVFDKIIESTQQQSEQANALKGLKTFQERGISPLSAYLSSDRGQPLLESVLRLTESSEDAIAQTAIEVSTGLESQLSEPAANGVNQSSTIQVLRDGLHKARPESLSVETLQDLARKILKQSAEVDARTAKDILPDAEVWSEALLPFLQGSYPPALAATNSLGGVVYLLTTNASNIEMQKSSTDADGFTAPFRMAQYTTAMLKEYEFFATLNDDTQQAVYRNLLLTVQIVNDKLSLSRANSIWQERNLAVELDMVSFVSDAQNLFAKWTRPAPSSSENNDTATQPNIESAQRQLLVDAHGTDPFAFHSARAYCASATESSEAYGWPHYSNTELEEKFRDIRKTGVFATAAFIVVFRPTLSNLPGFIRLCNELVASLTGADLRKGPEAALQSLILLNTMTAEDSPVLDAIPQQRMIFFIKHIISWLGEDIRNIAVKAETCKALFGSLYKIESIYGEHWDAIIKALLEIWGSTTQTDLDKTDGATLPLCHSSLRLFDFLRNLSLGDEANEDLVESWQASVEAMAINMVNLLKQAGNLPDENNQPLRMVNELLARQIATVPLDKLKDTTELYPLLFVTSFTVQRTAYSILHKQIPAAQEQVSINVALDKSNARLPEELLSIIMEAPTLESLADESFDRIMPLPLRSYLSSWILIFDHFKNASDKVKSDYAEHLKEGEYVNALLSFIFAFLGHARGKPVDASKFEITTYSFDIEDNPVKDVQWLLIYLYYLCLKHMPSVAKSWWIECKSRSLVQSVESWTEKYISPMIIADTMAAVSAWVNTQDSGEDDAMTIKTNARSKEIIVSREVDEQNLAISIRLPSNFPLGTPAVEGVHRVAVSEKKWQSWLLNTKGVITFSDNSITDGIIAFKRNVNGALKGQTECAICYSIVSTDKQLPTKKCSTCNNLFHGVCLYRWFQTSNSATCPLCRNPFSYHGRDVRGRTED